MGFVGLKEPMSRKEMSWEGTIIREDLHVSRYRGNTCVLLFWLLYQLQCHCVQHSEADAFIPICVSHRLGKLLILCAQGLKTLEWLA